MVTADGNQINMALAVQKLTDKYANEWGMHIGFAERVTIMNEQLGVIKQFLQLVDNSSGGVTMDKNNAAAYAIQLGLDLAGSAYVYAKKMKDETLKAQFYIRKKELSNVQEVLAVSKLKELLKHLGANTDRLEGYVTNEELLALGNAINDFEIQVANPRVFIVDRANSNEIVAAKVMELKSNFKDMDRLITKFRNTQFEREYRHARIVIELGKGGPGKGDNEQPAQGGPKGTAFS